MVFNHLSPAHPYIEMVATRSGSKPTIKGTRIAVSTIAGYIRLGESPESIAQSVLPHLTLAQIHDALSYYYEHQDEIEAELIHNTEAASHDRDCATLYAISKPSRTDRGQPVSASPVAG
jgi:uncharacterized protein (DUF433 family)